MAGKTITMSTVKQVIRLYKAGKSRKEIARILSISKNTVKKYIRQVEEKSVSGIPLYDKEDHELEVLFIHNDVQSSTRYKTLEKMFPYIKKELKRVGVNRNVLWMEYRNKHPLGYSYSQFCYHYQQWLKHKNATMHFEHDPGEELYIDFAGSKLSYIDKKSGNLIDVEVFVSVLGFSQLAYVEAVMSQKKADVINCCENALRFYGGAPKVIVPDNLKSAVKKASSYEAEVNETFRDFANYYGITVLPARSRKPRDKSLVEKAISIVYSRIYAKLRNRVFYSLAEINQAIRDLLVEYNKIAFTDRPYSRKEIFEQEEKHVLSPLPNESYEIKEYAWATVMKNSHVRLSSEKNYYSVPYRYIGKKVKIIYTSKHVSAFYHGERVMIHPRSYIRYGYNTQKEHLPSTHQFVASWNPGKFIDWAASIDPAVEHYIKEILERKNYPEQAYRSCVGILSMNKKIGKERLIAACKRGTHYQSYSYKVISRIINSKLYLLDPTQENLQKPIPFHDNIRGAENYK